MKKYKIAFWLTTGLIFITQGIMELFMLGNEQATAGISHLGYPSYFITMLILFKVIGSIVLIVPQIPSRYKEWAYAGFGIDFVAAFISIMAVDGFKGGAIFPIIAFGVLVISYISYHKINS